MGLARRGPRGKAQQPKVSQRSSLVNSGVGNGLEGMITALIGIPMLLVGFTLPAGNGKGTENILDLVAYLNLGAIADKLGGCTMATNVIFKGVDKSFVSLHAFKVGNK